MSVSEITYALFSRVLHRAQLDPDKWDKGRKGLDYSEAPPEVRIEDLNIPQTDPTAWVVALRYLAIAALAMLLTFIVVKLILNRKRVRQNAKSSVRELVEKNEQPTALSPLDKLYAALEEAKNRGDYREGVRLLYQIIIKHLHEKGKLLAAPDKTGREYVNELSREENTTEFFKITLLHESAWYGLKMIHKSEFEKMEPLFRSYIKSLDDGK